MSEYKKKFTFYGKEEYHAQFKLRMEYHSTAKQKKARSRIRSERSQGEDLVSKLGLGDDEIDNIFDIIAKEHPEL